MRRLGQILEPEPGDPRAEFSLGDRGERPPEETAVVRRRLREVESASASLGRRIEHLLRAQREAVRTGQLKPFAEVGDLVPDLDQNLDRLKLMFRSPQNADLIIRRFRLASHPRVEAAVAFMEGLSDRDTINQHILQPLMLLAHLDHDLKPPPEPPDRRGQAEPPARSEELLNRVMERLLPGNQAEPKPDMKTAVEAVLYGDTAIFISGVPKAIVVETKGFPLRSVSEPKQEMVIRGPLDAFNESFRTNIALVRRRLRDPRMVNEMLQVGEISKTYVGLCYVDGVANPKLVKEVKRRLEHLEIDFVPESGVLEQLIEDRPTSIFPQVLSTERPDRAAAYLSEGHVVLFADNSPLALVVPVTWWSIMQTAEDYYVRWPYGSMLRWLRTIALLFALFSGAVYIAASNYHPEMIPTGLMIAIAATREVVPFPAVVDLLLMELAFELIREAGIRIPSVIGPTIGIVGALILGQAAVEARLFSPMVIIVVAASGLSSFVVPNYNSAYGLRALRFLFIGLAATLGLYGLAVGALFFVLHLAGSRSFGVPFLSPVAPLRRGAADTASRGPLFQMERRPRAVRPVDEWRQPQVVRQWDPLVPAHLRRERRQRRDRQDGRR